MCALRTVQSFLGCIDLKIACITIAALRIAFCIIWIIWSIVLNLFFYEKVEATEMEKMRLFDEQHAKREIKINIAVRMIIGIPMSLLHIFVCYLFIKGATSNNPSRMRYYIIFDQIVLVLLCILGGWMLLVYGIGLPLISFIKMAITFVIILSVPIGIPYYILVCSHSLYLDYLKRQSQANEVTITENTVILLDNNHTSAPPQYDSCVNNMQPQSSDGTHHKAYP